MGGMIEVKKIEIKNFLSIENVVLEMEEGLWVVVGDNGSGKSALFEAMVWGLFGESVRGLHGDEVIRKGANECRVGIELNVCMIERTKYRGKGSEVKINNENCIQCKVEEIIGMDFLTFTNSVIHAQGFKRFAERTESEQKAILTKIMDLEKYDLYKETAEILLRNTENDINIQSKEIITIQNRLAELRKKDFKELFENFETARTKELLNIGDKILEHTKEKERIEKVIDEEENFISMNRVEELGDLIEEVKKLNDELKITISERNIYLTQLDNCNYKIKQLDTQMEKLEGLIGARCPTCDQLVTKEHIESCKDEIIKQKKHLQEMKSDLSQLNDKIDKRIDELNIRINSLSTIIADKQTLEHSLHMKRQSIQRYKEMLNKEAYYIKELQTMQNEILSRVNPYVELQHSHESEMVRVQEELDTALLKLKNLEETKKYYEFWCIGFGNRGIKSFIFDSIIPELTELTNKYIHSLTMKNIQIGFDTQREKKKGGLSEKFTIHIIDDVGKRALNAWSGGEKKRISMAIDLALSDIMMMRSKVPWDFVVFDECFDQLDSEGTEMLINLLKDLDKKSIYIISHESEIEGLIDNCIKVSKKEGRTSYEVYM